MKKIYFILFFFVWFWPLASVMAADQPDSRFLVLCYHDVPLKVQINDRYGVGVASFIQQIEFLKSEGWQFISVDDLLAARKGIKPLLGRSVLLTFDDGYMSQFEQVLPVLELYHIPAVWAVVTSWLDNPLPELEQRYGLMKWQHLRKAVESGFVEIASHSNDLHHSIGVDSYGDTSPANYARMYFQSSDRIESEKEYRQRLYNDFRSSYLILKQKLGIKPRVMVWPYGKYNTFNIEEAKRAGFEIMMNLDDGFGNLESLDTVPRTMMVDNLSLRDFIKDYKKGFVETDRERIVHADIDHLLDNDRDAQKKNVDAFIDRLLKIKPNIVYLQAFCDVEGTGNIASVYFPNRVLPTKTDLFNHVATQLRRRGIKVYAWMPMLSIVLPDEAVTDRLRVRELRAGRIGKSTSFYQRLSPFSSEAREKLSTLYEDLAIHAEIDGIVFQDDGYLNDFEDFHPEAQSKYLKISEGKLISFSELSAQQKQRWVELKTDTLIDLTEQIKRAVRRYQPLVVFARTLYASVLTAPKSEEWYAQNFGKSLQHYDRVVLMSYPRMEGVSDVDQWLRSLVRSAKSFPDGLNRTVFKVQSYDWKQKRWIKSQEIKRWLEILVAEGALHIGYYPDNMYIDEPKQEIIREIISTKNFPEKNDQ